MTQNLLTKRLKDAKRELTNLKTAHKRGLGLIRLYDYTGKVIPPNPLEAYKMQITVDFSRSFGKNPFAQFLRLTTHPERSWVGSAIRTEWEYYDNDGYSLVILGDYYDFYEDDTSQFTIISTSPITNVEIRLDVYE